ncbi:MAG: NAD(P)H-hydrate dehydratase [bacterium]|nr:NAD(P)H-hydrate dehydratase [bacterium]
MKIVTPKQMRAVDDTAINNMGMPSLVLMENAGAAVAETVALLDPGFIVALVGKGNNGGDGLVAARILADAGFEVNVVIFGDPDDLSGDAKVNYDLASQYPLDVWRFDGDLGRLGGLVAHADVAVDALLGTGATGGLRGEFADAARLLAENDSFVVAVDVPSGIDATTGEVEGAAVNADVTVTMGLPKSGMLQYPARGFVGESVVADIGFPRQLIDGLGYESAGEEPGYVADVTALGDVRELLPEPTLNAHKGTQGKGLLVAGSAGMSGAAVLAATSALRSGLGLCYAAIPSYIDDQFKANALEAISVPLPNDGGFLTPEALDGIKPYIETGDAFCIGPGLGRNPATGELLTGLISLIDKPIVMDADGLYHIGLEGLKKVIGGIITPHPGEMGNLYGVSAAEVEKDRMGYARRAASDTGLTVILKGYLSVIAAEGEAVYLNPTGNPGMATAGSGDVLSGVLLALLAGGLPPFEAALLGAYLHGLAGDMAADEMGELSLIAGDILECIPDAINLIEESELDVGLLNVFADY